MQATVRYPRLAAALADIERTGRTRAQLGRLAGRDGSAATRWAKGTHLPGWSAVKSLADAIRGERPDLADSLLAAWHYYSDPVEPGSALAPDLLAAIRRNFPGQEREAIEYLESFSSPTGPHEEAGSSREQPGRAG